MLSHSFLSYVIVEFTNEYVPEEHNYFPDKLSNGIPIPISIHRQNINCCSVTTISIRVCIPITINKTQGMTIGSGRTFEKVIVHLTLSFSITTPGLELVGISTAKDIDCLVIVGNTDMSIMTLIKIGTTSAYEKRRNFIQTLKPDLFLHIIIITMQILNYTQLRS